MISGFLLAALLRLTFASDLNVSTSKYSRSHNDLYDGPVLDTVVVRSTSHCAAVCSRNDRCYAFDVCPRTGSLKQVDCSLFGDSNLQAGNSLKPGTEKKCFQMVRPEVASKTSTTSSVGTTEPLRCENGGTLENGRCRCAIQYGGTTCERLIRDCTEPYENGYRNSSTVSLLIQPAGTSTPFWIVCVLDYGGLGYILLRNSLSASFNVNWATARTGIGDTSSAMTFFSNYFIGLENLHHMLSQADYMANVYCQYDGDAKGWVYYNNFTVGPQNSSYAMSYQSTFTYSTDYLDDGFNSQVPILFHTIDHDPNSVTKDTPGGLVLAAPGTVFLPTGYMASKGSS
ncbi:uncharacterized protein LOC112575300 [Pomacea canaliculata]|uniref:uncharacterized protein LOC112575300 n=1 Tax=Pomacea canaliculata TaxID=400727 RepID=UPI000D72CFDE|nr:uncharacterized protein LOC112575300 [Pomacea canaliculata]XP_025112839.1 uncharacterized protein LOC112575300 [Pomacea canaliculata]XP_025112840.1 uncharacterized protein LOC112575300 [Pomacea canaliculata]XP_025112841.1 uncharacterized protein LOC112575300 [Pomacea canaliculata]